MSEFKPILLTLSSLTPSLALEILPFGLTLHRVYVQVDGRTHDIVIGPESPEDHVTQKYTNTIVGRYANRIPVGTHKLDRNGITSDFTALANENPRVSLHGGPTGFDSVIWTLLTPEVPPTLFTAAELAHLTPSSSNSTHAVFRFVSADGDQGYPGKLIIEALVALIGPGEQERKYKATGDNLDTPEYDLGSIVLVYRAKLDEGGKKVVTPVNLTQHWGFNLEASLKEESLTVKEHILTIKSDRIAELGADSLATGSFLSAVENPSHAHASKTIGALFPEKSYDDFYYLNNEGASHIPTRIPLSSFGPNLDLIKELFEPPNNQGSQSRGTRPEPVVELASTKSGIKLVFDTNQHGVMFYANGLAKPSAGARKKIHGGSGVSGHGDSYGPGTAAFLEFHEPLTAFLDPRNKDKEDTLLTTDEMYHNYVRCDVRFKEGRI
ncbi:galactose mutarotase-like domain-containing protein [Collybia nuda]|uniref:Galactose mutarotase-like domain-containing protein n=1 Tax=Collybia nuda TaxID=64659 RepID=A0A9P5XYG2_9AGAR|nr:galactose mutarotase-like domain-containing protein [Collybia nuda]